MQMRVIRNMGIDKEDKTFQISKYNNQNFCELVQIWRVVLFYTYMHAYKHTYALQSVSNL